MRSLKKRVAELVVEKWWLQVPLVHMVSLYLCKPPPLGSAWHQPPKPHSCSPLKACSAAASFGVYIDYNIM